MYKKAMSEAVLVALIIAVVGLIIMGWAIKSITDTYITTTDREACRASIELKAQTILGFPVAENVPLKCKSQDIKIKDKDQEKMKETIANAMYDCWYEFGEGKIDFLGSDYGKFCFPCAKIGFDDSLKGETLIGFGDYLKEKKVSWTDKTFAELLYPSSTDLSSLNKIPLKDPIYSFYYADTGCYRSTGFKGLITGTVISCAGGAAIGVFAGGIGAIPACAAGGLMYFVAIPIKNYAFADEIKFEPTVILMSGEENMINQCNGPKDAWGKITEGLEYIKKCTN